MSLADLMGMILFIVICVCAVIGTPWLLWIGLTYFHKMSRREKITRLVGTIVPTILVIVVVLGILFSILGI